MRDQFKYKLSDIAKKFYYILAGLKVVNLVGVSETNFDARISFV